MRYTTVIDLTEFPDIWRNSNCTRLYLYMALRCGYHDQDRDVLTMSSRNLAMGAGITHSACRHALKVLQSHQLLSMEGNAWRVKKFVIDIKPSSRTQSTTAVSDHRLVEKDLRRENRERLIYAACRDATLKELSEAYEGLKNGSTQVNLGEVKFGHADVKTLADWIELKKSDRGKKIFRV